MSGVEQPAPAPRFSRTPPAVPNGPPERGEGGRRALADWGFGEDDVAKLKSLGLGFAS
jgi:alpha-methylacyl-CoA racemase